MPSTFEAHNFPYSKGSEASVGAVPTSISLPLTPSLWGLCDTAKVDNSSAIFQKITERATDSAVDEESQGPFALLSPSQEDLTTSTASSSSGVGSLGHLAHLLQTAPPLHTGNDSTWATSPRSGGGTDAHEAPLSVEGARPEVAYFRSRHAALLRDLQVEKNNF